MSAFLYDPTHPDFADHAYEIYRELRDEHPLYRAEPTSSWALSRYEDVRSAAADPATFSSEGTSISLGLLPMIQQLDPPRHDQLRDLLWKAFTPKRVAALEPRIREIASELIDAFVGEGRCDLLHAFASQLPSRVIGELIGIPPERRGDFLEWTEALITADPQRDWDTNPFALIYQEFTKLLDERRSDPRDDLVTALINAEIDGQGLTQEELLGFCFLLVVGGNDTTTNLLANGAVRLAQHPDQREALHRDPSGIPQAVDEMLRFDSPTQALPRIATRDVELHGQTIRAGEEVSLVWGAANHDERRFPDPERFDIRRENNRHLALGHGVHFCMGAHLARLEGRVSFEELLRRLPRYELESAPRWQTSRWARAYQAVPIRFEPA
ncbi:MAG: cytochrome P450 [Myxococcota bacterium]|nr:cytochrome P450 [Myxococcota bacterium]